MSRPTPNVPYLSTVPIMALPQGTPVLDLSANLPVPDYVYAIGKYNEKRPGIYTTELFSAVGGSSSGEGKGPRDIHVGIDLFGPVGTELHAFADGKVHLRAYNAAAGDYGYTLITEHLWDGKPLFALWGHLAARSVTDNPVGREFKAGDVIAWVGDRHENGGWPPHVHFQLCLERPLHCDLPGVVTAADREEALRLYPDPRTVLGPVY